MRYVLGSRASIGGVLGSGRGGAAAAWYLAGGVSAANCIAAYTPKGAASLAASYDNNAAPGNGLADGTYDAAPGVAPTFAAATGWTFGSGAYLTTTLVPVLDTTWSLLARFDYTGGGNYPTVLGVRNAISGGQVQEFSIAADDGVSGGANTNIVRNGQGNTGYKFTPRAEGVVGFAGLSAYQNGAYSGVLSSASCANARPLTIGGMNNQGTIQYLFLGTIQAIAIYNTTLTAPQVAAVSAAMAAL